MRNKSNTVKKEAKDQLRRDRSPKEGDHQNENLSSIIGGVDQDVIDKLEQEAKVAGENASNKELTADQCSTGHFICVWKEDYAAAHLVR